MVCIKYLVKGILISVIFNSHLLRAQDSLTSLTPVTDTRLTSGFWKTRTNIARDSTLPHIFSMLRMQGSIENFSIAAGLSESKFRGLRRDDSDVFKTVEAAARSLRFKYDDVLDNELDSLIKIIALAQEPDGYLYTIRTIYKDSTGMKDWLAGPDRYTFENGSHELYNQGHLLEAGVAHFQATGKRTLLDVAIKCADYLLRSFGNGPGRKIVAPGHQEIEIGLIKLYEVTHNDKYLALANYFIAMRGRPDKRALYLDSHGLGPAYFQDHKPVIHQKDAVGHAVRGQYLYCAMTDLSRLGYSTEYNTILDSLWLDVATRKQYVTGGVGSRAEGEAFGDPYSLSNDSSYAETCAAVANLYWNFRMYLGTGRSRYLALFERVLYNAYLAGGSIDGTKFFYTNPMSSAGIKNNSILSDQRSSWFGINCCPTNHARFIFGLADYIYAKSHDTVFVNFFINSRTDIELSQTKLKIEQQSMFPWEGNIKLTVSPEKDELFTVAIRIPDYLSPLNSVNNLYYYDDACNVDILVSVNGSRFTSENQGGYLKIKRMWKKGDEIRLIFDLPIRIIKPNVKLTVNRGLVSVSRGPLIYCFEGIDNKIPLAKLNFSPGQCFKSVYSQKYFKGSVVLESANKTPVTLIPYYLWANRGPTEMTVWMRQSENVSNN
jgi:DUF1680 family protein